MYRWLLIIQDQSGFGLEVLQRLWQRLQCLDSVRLLAAYILQSEYSAYLTSVSLRDTKGSCTSSYHKQCCLQPQPPQELTLGGSFEVPP